MSECVCVGVFPAFVAWAVGASRHRDNWEVCARECVCMCACVRACVRACMGMGVCAHASLLSEGQIHFISAAH